MNQNALPFLLLQMIQFFFYALSAPMVVGLIRWFKARLQGRRGADMRQPYRDLFKLIRKQTNIPESASPLFRIAPPIIFACYLLPGIFLPIFTTTTNVPFLGQGLDLLFIVYLLGLAKFVSGLAAFDAGSPFGAMSSGRQFFIHILVEPVFLTVIYALALVGRTSNLATLVLRDDGILGNLALVFILLTLGSLFLAEGGRLPFDNPGTHLELTMIEEGTYLGYSGRMLALIEWANAMKLTFFLSLLANLAFPWSIAKDLISTNLISSVVSFIAKLVFLAFLLAMWEMCQAKSRLRKVSEPLILALVPALVALIVAMLSYLFGG